ncbi:hypothetical protein SKAU_G00188410 [Synaphobranchus kaupii]|uniref:Uncharacterized protein n=1 Tax=Synaphobranchus kaupii TaxID=118154 RepID=A0A9Q1IUY6_SYNKA|nr:hypothetical protein SKAU_G00188410 [Synaphobranchus kaupii]
MCCSSACRERFDSHLRVWQGRPLTEAPSRVTPRSRARGGGVTRSELMGVPCHPAHRSGWNAGLGRSVCNKGKEAIPPTGIPAHDGCELLLITRGPNGVLPQVSLEKQAWILSFLMNGFQ